jgi:hypothetical protein
MLSSAEGVSGAEGANHPVKSVTFRDLVQDSRGIV